MKKFKLILLLAGLLGLFASCEGNKYRGYLEIENCTSGKKDTVFVSGRYVISTYKEAVPVLRYFGENGHRIEKLNICDCRELKK